MFCDQCGSGLCGDEQAGLQAANRIIESLDALQMLLLCLVRIRLLSGALKPNSLPHFCLQFSLSASVSSFCLILQPISMLSCAAITDSTLYFIASFIVDYFIWSIINMSW